MSIGRIGAAGLFATLLAVGASHAQMPAKVSVDFPDSVRELPPGPGLELVQTNCTACHSPGMILTQPKLTKATWTAEVTKMRQTYKAPVADEDVEPIVAYLTDMPVPK